MERIFYLIAVIFFLSFHLRAQEGMITIESEQNVNQTADHLQALIKEKGLTFFARVNHSDNAEKVDMQLRPTILLIFGNPKLGTPLMQCSQTCAIDLPQKALIYEDEDGRVWISYNDQEYLAKRHHLEKCEKELKKVEDALAGLIKQAATK